VLIETIRAVNAGGTTIVSRGIALVPEGRKLFPSLTVEENIQVGAVAAGSAEWPLDRIYETFPMIARRRGQRASTLSGGGRCGTACWPRCW
jgi:branched-chain amino acid transport system ATP-binding protein